MSTPPRSSTPVRRAELTELLTGLSRAFRTAPGSAAVDAVAQSSIVHVPGCRWAAVTTLRQGRAHTLAVTGEPAAEAEALQHELGSGPRLDPALEGQPHVSADLGQDRRWPVFGRRVQDQLGMTGLLAYRMPLPGDVETTVGLTLYSDTADAFDARTLWAGGVLASQAALAVAGQVHHRHRENLERALASNRDIGAAIGVLMTRHGILRDAAFDLLRETSQTTNRRLAELADVVLRTGELP
ncbi:GAF and ANTAR domain-containing protein [Kocuria aegyptia]|uniref:GAF and ANTAR domain-containing protein n=1 Tax=Kocuria aegyptia TaxID=330943 RepID=UPI0031DE7CF8